MTVQVHEKSIMLALLPATLLAFEDPDLAAWLPVWGTLGMFPLLRKDGLSIAYIACLLLWLCVAPPPNALVPVDSADAVSEDKGQRSVQQQVSRGSFAEVLRGLGSSAVGAERVLHSSRFASVLTAAGVHFAQCCVDPPVRFPFLFDAAYVSLAFVQICGAMLLTNCKQWMAAGIEPDQSHMHVKQR